MLIADLPLMRSLSNQQMSTIALPFTVLVFRRALCLNENPSFFLNLKQKAFHFPVQEDPAGFGTID